MRAVLIVLGIAIFAIVISALVKRPKDASETITPYPQEREQARRDAASASVAPSTPKTAGRAEPEFKPPKEGAVQAVLSIEGKPDIVIEMYPKVAPKTVAQISGLIKQGFYNGIKVHRVEPEFVVQTGDPQTKTMGIDAPGIGTGGSGKNIPFEFNGLNHVRGSVAMALSSPKSDTADSQWFINLSYNSSLDTEYCVFGKVLEGLETVDKIAKGDTIKSLTLK